MNNLLSPTLLYIIECSTSFLLAVLIEIIILPRVLLISKKKRLYDIPDKRKSHKNLIPRLAGISFFPVIMLSFLPILGLQAFLSDNTSTIYSAAFIIRLSFIICGAMLLVLLGIKDDLISVRYSHKFIIQSASTLLLIISGTYINNLYGLLGIYEIPSYIGIPFTLLLSVYIINSINLIDGVDGLAAIISLIASFILGIYLLMKADYTYALMAFATSGLLIPFLYYNVFSKRKIFMGDTGSLTLGYVLAFLAIHYSIREPQEQGELQPIIIAWSVLFVPLFDTARVMCVRASQKKPIFSPDRNHIHHKLLDIGCSHRQVTCILALCALCIIVLNICLQGIANINLILALNLAAGILFNIYLNKKKQKITQSRKSPLPYPENITLGNYVISTNYTFKRIPGEQTVINTINPHSWVTADRDAAFKQALQNSDGLVPDGTGIILAAQWLTGRQIRKTAGADLHRMVLEHLNRVRGSVFYLGASTRTLTLITERIHAEYPGIRVATFSPPYRESFSEKETAQMIEAVNNFRPDVLFVGMTAPKQEKWIAANKHLLQARFISGIGAVFGFYGGTTPRPPQWLISCGLEWLGRLLKEPRRMWRRNFISTPKFLYIIFRLKFKKKTIKTIPEYEIN